MKSTTYNACFHEFELYVRNNGFSYIGTFIELQPDYLGENMSYFAIARNCGGTWLRNYGYMVAEWFVVQIT